MVDDDVRNRVMHAAILINERNPTDMLRWVARLLVHEHEVAMGADAALRDPANIAPPLGHRASCETCKETAVVAPLLRNALRTAP